MDYFVSVFLLSVFTFLLFQESVLEVNKQIIQVPLNHQNFVLAHSSNKLEAMRWQWNILRNEMALLVYKAVCYFIHYAVRAFAKAIR